MTTRRARFLVRVDPQRCKGCRLCVDVCPRKVLAMSSDFNRKGLHFAVVDTQADCSGCRNCTVICPDVAIELHQEESAADTGDGSIRWNHSSRSG